MWYAYLVIQFNAPCILEREWGDWSSICCLLLSISAWLPQLKDNGWGIYYYLLVKWSGVGDKVMKLMSGRKSGDRSINIKTEPGDMWDWEDLIELILKENMWTYLHVVLYCFYFTKATSFYPKHPQTWSLKKLCVLRTQCLCILPFHHTSFQYFINSTKLQPFN